jgi:hypothetical protein
MRCLLPLGCILIFPMVMAGSEGVVVIQGDMRASNIFPTFDRGYLATYELNAVAVYAPDGSLAMRIAKPAGGNFVNADMDSDGSVAVAFHQGGRTGGIAIYYRDGSPEGQMMTGVWQPSQVCFAPDHSIWAVGDQDRLPEMDRIDYFLLRHYSRDGVLLGESLQRSWFPADAWPGQVVVGGWRLRIVHDRIGMVLDRSGKNNGILWLETDLSGKETGRWTTPSGGVPRAMTESGDVYVQGMGSISVLDRATNSWKPVPQTFNDGILGAEGDTLVFAVRGMNEVRRASQP